MLETYDNVEVSCGERFVADSPVACYKHEYNHLGEINQLVTENKCSKKV